MTDFEFKTRMGDIPESWDKKTLSLLAYLTELQEGYIEQANITTPARFVRFCESYTSRKAKNGLFGFHSDNTRFFQSCAYYAPDGTLKKAHFGVGKAAYIAAWESEQVKLHDVVNAFNLPHGELDASMQDAIRHMTVKPSCDGYNGEVFEVSVRNWLIRYGMAEGEIVYKIAPQGENDASLKSFAAETIRELVFSR